MSLHDFISKDLEENQEYELVSKMTWLSDEEIRQYVLFNTVDSIKVWLEENGY